LTADQRALLGSFERTMNVLVITGAWCGDCAVQCPMLGAIADACPTSSVRFLEQSDHPHRQTTLFLHFADNSLLRLLTKFYLTSHKLPFPHRAWNRGVNPMRNENPPFRISHHTQRNNNLTPGRTNICHVHIFGSIEKRHENPRAFGFRV
ncbi:MAG: thioredoxin family protein, partial [Candidatus Doudnabacteria bacterium]|nr:thioredoxin family protein [Candidatus Doudnabacteria bacterium]